MKFALFYEIPVARPWDAPERAMRAYKDALEQAQLADHLGFHAFWTVEHHFLEEYSHCSNPEVLYGAIAAKTENIRIGYGVRLMPKPYNHPVRTAESVAVLDLISDGRVEFGTGRSATVAEPEGFGIHPDDTRGMWEEALRCVVECWTNDEYEFQGKYWDLPRSAGRPEAVQKPHPPLWGATTSPEGHEVMGRHGLGVCSFTVGLPPEDLKERIDLYRKGQSECTDPIGTFVNDQIATFTMAHCADARGGAGGGEGVDRVVSRRATGGSAPSPSGWRMKQADLGTTPTPNGCRPPPFGPDERRPSTTSSTSAPASSATPTTASSTAASTRRPGATCSCACSTRTRSRTTRPCSRSS